MKIILITLLFCVVGLCIASNQPQCLNKCDPSKGAWSPQYTSCLTKSNQVCNSNSTMNDTFDITKMPVYSDCVYGIALPKEYIIKIAYKESTPFLVLPCNFSSYVRCKPTPTPTPKPTTNSTTNNTNTTTTTTTEPVCTDYFAVPLHEKQVKDKETNCYFDAKYPWMTNCDVANGFHCHHASFKCIRTVPQQTNQFVDCTGNVNVCQAEYQRCECKNNTSMLPLYGRSKCVANSPIRNAQNMSLCMEATDKFFACSVANKTTGTLNATTDTTCPEARCPQEYCNMMTTCSDPCHQNVYDSGMVIWPSGKPSGKPSGGGSRWNPNRNNDHHSNKMSSKVFYAIIFSVVGAVCIFIVVTALLVRRCLIKRLNQRFKLPQNGNKIKQTKEYRVKIK
ncbi:hypothetical protein DFA_05815 [Cavenderia fasciculata]|uniref:Uncharacterized protein n=1 Tax=Cavenderia fasciculata TaxID=261658 RepID=F4PMT7_CACFS|nr:uncharacterized protein DFA_05815 [Cavenderia fasciculata]EGG23681.1 hypothetical protein DFA_05815 [Cavenderia fasciculata]|eukprot:XP_004361532.1 hypothetical protein DFA_05815 [Cavenderia fasciculata]